MVLHLPVAGRLVRKVAVARLARTLASQLSSGVSVLEALASASRTAGNDVIEKAILDSRESVARGVDISTALSRHSVLPPLVGNMVGVGEQTGKLDEMLAKVADFFERESEAEIEGLLRALEPALVVLVGIVLGGIVMAMYLPIFDAIGAVDPIGA
jgi:type IV pilus assembly protein PilC